MDIVTLEKNRYYVPSLSTMAILLHLADERKAEIIRKGGIKIKRNGMGIYCLPVLPDFFVSHQWLRELKRSGVNTLVGIYFKGDEKELVYAGRYNEPHKKIPLGEAIKEIMSLSDPLGYELIIDRKIEAEEIIKIKHLPQHVGWRYFPESHNKKPCPCEYCLKSSIKGKRTFNRLNKETD